MLIKINRHKVKNFTILPPLVFLLAVICKRPADNVGGLRRIRKLFFLVFQKNMLVVSLT
jgi:hypothetical protein